MKDGRKKGSRGRKEGSQGREVENGRRKAN